MSEGKEGIGENGKTESATIQNKHLSQPILHLKTANISDQEIMNVLHECLRAKPNMKRENVENSEQITGIIEFEELLNAEKAYATLQDFHFPTTNNNFILSINENPENDTKPSAKTRLAKHLPENYTPGAVFHLFRRFGPLYRVSLQISPNGKFSGLAVVDFYEEEHAANAAADLHFSELEGMTIAVQIYDQSKGPLRGIGSWAEAPPFVPKQRATSYEGSQRPSNMPADALWTPPRRSFTHHAATPSIMSTLTSPETSPPHQNGYYANPIPYDPTNLFCKSLHPLISSQDLFTAFKAYGRIISARVMRDERTGNSKEFGFVSFSRPEEAAAAQQALDGQPLWGQYGHSPAIIVRFHEPKKPRELRNRDRYSSPRERANSYDAEIEDDITKRVTGFSPTSSPPMSPASQQGFSHAMLRHASISSSGSSSPPSIAGGMPMTIPPTAPMNETDRLLDAVTRMGYPRATEIAGLLQSLPKRDRALCLFNAEIMRTKVQEASNVLDAQGDESVVGQVTEIFANMKTTEEQSMNGSEMTLQQIAALPATKIIELAQAANPSPILASPNPDTVAQTDAFVDSLMEKQVSEQKQKLGEKLFKIIKSFGIFKNAPKLTIYLLDTEDLRALAHLSWSSNMLKVSDRPK